MTENAPDRTVRGSTSVTMAGTPHAVPPPPPPRPHRVAATASPDSNTSYPVSSISPNSSLEYTTMSGCECSGMAPPARIKKTDTETAASWYSPRNCTSRFHRAADATTADSPHAKIESTVADRTAAATASDCCCCRLEATAAGGAAATATVAVWLALTTASISPGAARESHGSPRPIAPSTASPTTSSPNPLSPSAAGCCVRTVCAGGAFAWRRAPRCFGRLGGVSGESGVEGAAATRFASRVSSSHAPTAALRLSMHAIDTVGDTG
mmetsp:Transcript_3157/g.7637  ORF Transcript_3157/g.7637 Transcript_3157/m.7637 type:complete len:267 (+) Transcript_3157:624-1424(+)